MKIVFILPSTFKFVCLILFVCAFISLFLSALFHYCNRYESLCSLLEALLAPEIAECRVCTETERGNNNNQIPQVSNEIHGLPIVKF